MLWPLVGGLSGSMSKSKEVPASCGTSTIM
jgi:hypothetical protein